MKVLIIASANAHKVAEMKASLAAVLPDYEILSLADLTERPTIVEDGQTFAENAQIKAAALAQAYPEALVLADDSGLMVDALDGAPGVYSARYAGDHDDDKNNQKLLAELAKQPDCDRRAHFVTVLVLTQAGRQPLQVTGQVTGTITELAVGEQRFGYDPLFYLPEQGKTFAQMTATEKNQFSHRGRALVALAAALPDWLAQGQAE
ncbi:XTP/dITP diphosphatase [Leuconostocaceae bacterium ESL0958]|nr:XTP/dITP diphosphatase [Leuconostocaceae bacterium ESL0958]